MARNRLKWILVVYVFFLSAYFITFRGYFYSWDAYMRLKVAESMVHAGNIRAKPDFSTVRTREGNSPPKTPAEVDPANARWPAIRRGRGGNYYLFAWGLGQSITFIPAVAISDLIKAVVPSAPVREIEKMLAVVPVVFFAAGAALFVCLTAEALGFGRRRSFAAAALYAFATMAWHYSKSSYEVAQVSFFAVAAGYFFLLALYNEKRINRHLLLSGAFVAAAFLTRKPTIFVCLTLSFAWVATCLTRASKGLQKYSIMIRGLVAFGVGPLLAIILWLALNYYLWGYPFPELHSVSSAAGGGKQVPAYLIGGLIRGCFGSLLSPGYGLFVFNPCLLLGVFALPALVKKNTAFWLWFLGLATTYIIFLGTFKDCGAGGTVGPRYLSIIVPFLSVAAVAFFGGSPLYRCHLVKGFGVVLIGFSLIIQLFNVSLPPWRYSNYRMVHGESYHFDAFHIEESPIIWNPIMLYQVLTFEPGDYTSPEIPREEMTPQQYLNTIQMSSLDFYWVLFPKFGYPKVLFYIPLALSVAVCLGSLYYLLRATRFLGKSVRTVRNGKWRNLGISGTATPRLWLP